MKAWAVLLSGALQGIWSLPSSSPCSLDTSLKLGTLACEHVRPPSFQDVLTYMGMKWADSKCPALQQTISNTTMAADNAAPSKRADVPSLSDAPTYKGMKWADAKCPVCAAHKKQYNHGVRRCCSSAARLRHWPLRSVCYDDMTLHRCRWRDLEQTSRASSIIQSHN